MKAIILAAGQGTRLRPYTNDRPKCLVEVEGKSLLDRQLEVLASEDVTSIVVVGGYRSQMLRRPGFVLHINPQFADTNMVWTLFCAEDEMDGDVLVCYGDIVYSREALRAVLASDAEISVAIDLEWENYWRARNEDPLDDAETLRLASDGAILEIGQKPKSLVEIEGQYMGLMKFTANGVEILKRVFRAAEAAGSLGGKAVENAYMTDLLQALINQGFRLDAVPVYGGWVEVDTVSDLQSELTRDRLAKIEAGL